MIDPPRKRNRKTICKTNNLKEVGHPKLWWILESLMLSQRSLWSILTSDGTVSWVKATHAFDVANVGAIPAEYPGTFPNCPQGSGGKSEEKQHMKKSCTASSLAGCLKWMHSSVFYKWSNSLCDALQLHEPCAASHSLSTRC